MKIKFFPHNFKKVLISLILIASSFFFVVQNAVAAPDYVRKTWVDDGGSCQTEKLDFGPMMSNDQEWEIDNPTCVAYVAVSGAAILAAVTASSYLCQNPQAAAIQAASIAAGVVLSPKMIQDRIIETATCVQFTAQCAASVGVNAPACGFATSCCAGTAITLVTTGAVIGALAIIWQAAVDSQKDAHICGEAWNTWKERAAAQENVNDGSGIPNYQEGSLPNNKMYIRGKGDLSYQKKLEDKYQGGTMKLAITDKEYREFIYGGMETEDNGDGACQNPASWSDENKDKILGFHTSNQRYYMRGAAMASNYACGRFLLRKGTPQEKQDAKEAYECCKKRSQETLCIEESNAVANAAISITNTATTPFSGSSISDIKNHKFCKLGDRCKVQNVWYNIHTAKTVPNYICATTYSVCPYNHNMGGGTEIADYDKKYKTLLNHCQYLKHCSKKPDVPYIRTSDLEGALISGACFDLKGNSQNEYEYDGPLTPVNKTKNFSAPIAQCFKETLENLLINKAGHTKCKSPDEEPDQNGNCSNGYNYKAGEIVVGQKSFFQTIQEHLQTAIKLVMTIAITVAGIAVLLSGTPWDKKTIIMFIIKLGLVSYFALGTAWQDYFFRGVSGASTDLAQIFMRLDQDKTADDQDGCQFPRFNHAFVDGVTPGSKYDSPSYPLGKEYLQIWDMLDCKIARALGFGPEVSVPNLIVMILAGLISNGLGLVFFIATFIFAFYLIALTVRALHIFLISSMAITIMIYVSPITITACLFKKTESIFKSWRTNLVGFVLQPVILFAYLGILITIFDKTMIGDAKFTGDGKANPKHIDCSVGDAGNNSIYCIFQFNNVQTNNALSPLGITLPVLFGMNQAKLATIIKAAFLMFIFTAFLDKITALAAQLVGGVELASNSSGTINIAQKALGVAQAVQSRGSRAVRKWGGKAAEKIGGSLNNKASDYKTKPKDGAPRKGGDKIGKATNETEKPTGNAIREGGDKSGITNNKKDTGDISYGKTDK